MSYNKPQVTVNSLNKVALKRTNDGDNSSEKKGKYSINHT